MVQGLTLVRGSLDKNCMLIDNDQPFKKTAIPPLVFIPFKRNEDYSGVFEVNKKQTLKKMKKEDPYFFDAVFCEKSFSIYIRKNNKQYETDPYKLYRNKKICFEYDEKKLNAKDDGGDLSLDQAAIIQRSTKSIKTHFL